MARHRSPRGPVLSGRLAPRAVLAGAGPSGIHRALSVPAVQRGRIVVTAVAGTALAVAGQSAIAHALSGADPAPGPADTTADTDSSPAVALLNPPSPPDAASVEPVVADAAALIGFAGFAVVQPVHAPAAASAPAAAPAPVRVPKPVSAPVTSVAKPSAKPVPSPPPAPEPAAAPVPARVAPAPAPARVAPAPAAPAKPAPAAPAKPPTVAVGGFVRPVEGRVTSGFGMRGGTMHYGLDIANVIGTPIHAVAAGTVISAGPASGFGLWVRLRHADGTITVYGHVNRFFVRVGQQVNAGDVIAEVGNRGQSTGPHLHIEVWNPAGKKIDPRPWLAARGITW